MASISGVERTVYQEGQSYIEVRPRLSGGWLGWGLARTKLATGTASLPSQPKNPVPKMVKVARQSTKALCPGCGPGSKAPRTAA